jgi:hypothetical protein
MAALRGGDKLVPGYPGHRRHDTRIQGFLVEIQAGVAYILLDFFNQLLAGLRILVTCKRRCRQ